MRQHFSAACGVAALIVVAIVSTATGADDASSAKDVFDTLFAKKMRVALATNDRADDVALAREMLDLAQTSENQTALIEILCERAYDLGQRHNDGLSTAADAMELLADSVPSKRDQARTRLTAILSRQMSVGDVDARLDAADRMVEILIESGDAKMAERRYADALSDFRQAYGVAVQKKLASHERAKSRLELASARDKAQKQIAALEAKLHADAGKQEAAAEIAMLYVVELADPASAAPFAERSGNDELKAVVPLLTKAEDTLGETELLAAAEWCFTAGRDHNPPLKHLLDRSDRCLSRFLDLHTQTDLSRTKAEAIRKEVAAILEKLKPAAGSGTGEDPIAGWDARIWGGSRWARRGLRILQTSVSGKVVSATHVGLVSQEVVFLTFEALEIPANVSFEVTIRVSGKGQVGLLRSAGQLRGFMGVTIETMGQPVVVIRRVSGSLFFLVNGKPVKPDLKGSSAGANDAYVLAIKLGKKETVRVHEIDFKIAE